MFSIYLHSKITSMNFRFYSLFLLSLIALFSTSCNNSRRIVTHANPDKKPTNIILMIGDGMSIPQITASMISNEKRTSFERFPYSGLVKTHSKSNKITDSAAGGTAIATGHKTNNGMIGMNADSIAVPSILELLSDKGKKTGILVTCRVNHATPAAFISKNINRNNYYEIANDIANTEKLDLLMGGGRKYFIDRNDGKNLIDTMISKGWTYYDTISDIDINKDKILVLADEKDLEAYPQRGNFLPDAASLALEALNKNNDNGFFLMIEGSQIDFAGHDNDSSYLINEMTDFNNTINVVLDFAEKNQNTIVIVTADHETGGLTIIDPDQRYTNTYFHFSTGSHSPLLVPIFAFGPGSEKFSGIMDNTDIIKKILETLE